MIRRPIALAIPMLLFAAAEPAPFGRLVAIDGRKLHVHCAGQGGPVVLFLNGMPRFSLHFALVQPEVAKFTTSCVYDRAGEAWSEAAPGEPTAAASIAEVDAMVRHTGGGKPVVLAGHSYGGLLARAYYAKHPRGVAGIVLIDSVGDPPIVPVAGAKKPMTELTPDDIGTLAAQMAERAKSAVIADPRIEPPFDRLPAALQPAHIWATRKWRELSLRIDPAAGLQYQVDMNRAVLGQSLGDLPLAVITRAKSDTDADSWIEQQQRMARLSTKGRLLRAVGSGHDIELDQPGIVVDAIRGVVDAARAAR